MHKYLRLARKMHRMAGNLHTRHTTAVELKQMPGCCTAAQSTHTPHTRTHTDVGRDIERDYGSFLLLCVTRSPAFRWILLNAMDKGNTVRAIWLGAHATQTTQNLTFATTQCSSAMPGR